MQRCKQRSLNDIATLASLLEPAELDEDAMFALDTDLGEILSYLNDNDMEKYNSIRQKKRELFRNKFK